MKQKIIDAKPVKVEVIKDPRGKNKVNILDDPNKLILYFKLGVAGLLILMLLFVFIKNNI